MSEGNATNSWKQAPLGACLVAGGVLWANLAAGGPLIQVSDDSTLDPNCGDFTDFPPGTEFRDSEVEPWVDVNPTDPLNIVAFWQQDRWSNGGARSNVAGVSEDGGDTWTIVEVPELTDCSGGEFERSSDPWVSFAPDGTLHQVSLLFNVDADDRNAIGVSKSDDGGFTWTSPILVRDDPVDFNDKESITADPTDSNFVYTVWDQIQEFGLFFKGPTYFARTVDGGDSWEPASVIFDPGFLNQTIANQIAVFPNGIVVNVFTDIRNVGQNPGIFLSLRWSLNKGSTWRPASPMANRIARIFSTGVVTPDFQQAVRDASILFDIAVDAGSGDIYAVWQDRRFNGVEQVAFSMSENLGRTWSTPIKVSQTPDTGGNPLLEQAFLPSVAVTGDGRVGVSYYDFRNDDNTGELADHWLVSCDAIVADCTDMANWGDEVRLTDASFDYLLAPDANGLFIGDYEGLAADATDFLSFFQQTVSGNDPASGFFRRVEPPLP